MSADEDQDQPPAFSWVADDPPLSSRADEAGPGTQGPQPEPAGPGSAQRSGRADKTEKKKKRSWAARILIVLLIVMAIVPVGLTLVYRLVPPPITILMVERLAQGQGLHKSWRPLPRISPALAQAVIAAEDARFCTHHGFDFQAIEKALANNERRPTAIRGGSTISQQTAKNVFLWPDRSYVRKGLEAYFTVLIEALWGKRRILEVYLNVAEWGPGTYGAEAAAQRYFHTSAAQLSRTQASRLAAVLPSPLRYKAATPGPYVARRSRRIGAAAATVRQSDLGGCIRG